MNNTLGGSNDINDMPSATAKSMTCGTFCLKLKSLKLIYAILLTIKTERVRINNMVNVK